MDDRQKQDYEDYTDQMFEVIRRLEEEYKGSPTKLKLLRIYSLYRKLKQPVPERVLTQLDKYVEGQLDNEISRRADKKCKLKLGEYLALKNNGNPTSERDKLANKYNCIRKTIDNWYKKYDEKWGGKLDRK